MEQNLHDELLALQDQFANIDLFTKGSNGYRQLLIEVLIREIKNLKIKIYQEPGHKMPHLHIDYGKNNNHIASYNIETGERIEGSLDKKYDKSVRDWIYENRKKILQIWNEIQIGNKDKYEEMISAIKE